MPQRISRTAWVIFLLWLFLYSSFALLTPPLLDGTDALNAEIAREMLLRRDPVTLYANGIRILDQAPLLHWSIAANMGIFGVSTGAARFPLAVFALLLFLVTAMFARRCFESERSALYAGIGVALSFGSFLFTRVLIPDAVVCLWFTAALFCFWLAETGPPTYSDAAPILPCLGFAAGCALNVLTKGLIGLIFPVATVLFYLLLTRGVRQAARRLWQLHPFLSTLVFTAIAAPWHILAARATPTEGRPAGITHTLAGWQIPMPRASSIHGWSWFYFADNHVLRFLNQRIPHVYSHMPLAGHMPLALFWSSVLVLTLPWSIFLYKALGAVPWQRLLRRSTATLLDGEDKAAVLLTIAALVPLLFFSLTPRRLSYAVPSIPFLIMLIARWLDREAFESDFMIVPAPLNKSAVRISTALFYAGCIVALGCGFLAVHTHAPLPGTDLAMLLQQHAGTAASAFSDVRNFNPDALTLFRDPLALAAVSVLLGTGGGWWFRRNSMPHYANIALAIGTVGCLVATHKTVSTFGSVRNSASLATQLEPLLRPDSLIVINDDYEAAASLGFYLQRDTLHILHGRSAGLWSGSFFHDAPDLFETDESIARKWQQPGRIFLWSKPENMSSLPTPYYVVAYGGGNEIVSNKPNEDPVTRHDEERLPELPTAPDPDPMFPAMPLPDLFPTVPEPSPLAPAPLGPIETVPPATPLDLPRSSTPRSTGQSNPAPAAATDPATPARPATGQPPPAAPTQPAPAAPD